MILTLFDLVLIILGLQDKPINGLEVMRGEVYLLYRELKDKITIDLMDFENLNFSEYLDSMEYSGYIEIRHRRSKRLRKFMLTKKGRAISEALIFILEEALGSEYVKRLRELRIGWDQLGNEGIARYIAQVKEG